MKRLYILLLCAGSLWGKSYQKRAAENHPNQESCQLSKKITITNRIDPKKLSYNFLGISYTPDSFSVHVNQTPLQLGNSIEIPAQKTMTVRYEYSFANGWRTGAKEIEFDVAAPQANCDLTFSWDNKWRVMATGATPRKAKRLKYHA